MKRIAALGAGMLLAASLFAAEPESSDPQPAVNTSAPREPVTGRGNPRRPGVTVGPAAATDTPAPPAPTARQPAAQDRIELSTTQITGNAELPRVMYVVPWKRAELGDLAGKPAKSLLDEVLSPVDRDVFRRQNRYYDALQPDARPAAPEGEK